MGMIVTNAGCSVEIVRQNIRRLLQSPGSRYSCYRCAWAFWRILGFVGAFAGAEAAVVLAGEAPLPVGAAPLALVPGADAGVAAGVGNDVSGVGSGGSGLGRTLAIILFRPFSAFFLYVY